MLRIHCIYFSLKQGIVLPKSEGTQLQDLQLPLLKEKINLGHQFQQWIGLCMAG